MDAINKRVVEFVSTTGLSKKDFAQQLGVSAAVLSHISSGRNKVGLEIVQKMVVAYPKLSALWLVSGQGSMYEQSDSQKVLLLEESIASLQKELTDISNRLNVVNRSIGKLKQVF